MAMVSPCCTRACITSMRPPAACNSLNRTGQGLGAKFFSPRSIAVMSASSGAAVAGCKVGAEPCASLSTTSITGLLRTEPATMRPSSTMRLALNMRSFSAPLTRSSTRSSSTVSTRSGDVGSPCTLACALRQLATNDVDAPGSVMVSGPMIVLVSTVGSNTSAVTSMSCAFRLIGGLVVVNSALALAQRTWMLNGKPLTVCDAQL